MAKLHVLETLCDLSNATAREVAEHLGIEPPAAGMALLRLIRQGLATRQEGFSPTVCNVFGAQTAPHFRRQLHYGCSGVFV